LWGAVARNVNKEKVVAKSVRKEKDKSAESNASRYDIVLERLDDEEKAACAEFTPPSPAEQNNNRGGQIAQRFVEEKAAMTDRFKRAGEVFSTK
jgi:hypothetical protein